MLTYNTGVLNTHIGVFVLKARESYLVYLTKYAVFFPTNALQNVAALTIINQLLKEERLVVHKNKTSEDNINVLSKSKVQGSGRLSIAPSSFWLDCV